jgi:hypothetical protein
MKRIYTIVAYRWGDKECHSYSVGVSTNLVEALEIAKQEEINRGGKKYICEVIQWTKAVGEKKYTKCIIKRL